MTDQIIGQWREFLTNRGKNYDVLSGKWMDFRWWEAERWPRTNWNTHPASTDRKYSGFYFF